MGISLLLLILTSGVAPEGALSTHHDLDSQVIEQRINEETVDTATPMPIPTPKRAVKPVKTAPSFTVNVAEIITKYANEYRIDPRIMVTIAQCESGLRPDATNGPYGGIFQFSSTTWISNRRAMRLNEDTSLRFNPEEAAKTAAYKMARDGFGAWPSCSKKALAFVK